MGKVRVKTDSLGHPREFFVVVNARGGVSNPRLTHAGAVLVAARLDAAIPNRAPHVVRRAAVQLRVDDAQPEPDSYYLPGRSA